jgi:hypothetical protein
VLRRVPMPWLVYRSVAFQLLSINYLILCAGDL